MHKHEQDSKNRSRLANTLIFAPVLDKKRLINFDNCVGVYKLKYTL